MTLLLLTMSCLWFATPSLGQEGNQPKDTTSKSTESPLAVAEKMPKFKGGDLLSFRDWVMQNLKYPQQAAKDKIEGKVVALFVIEKDGQLTSVKILQSPDQLLSDELIRVLYSSPKWTPGMQKGKNVRVKYTIPVTFQNTKHRAR